jgi:hypothetical protein
MRLLDTDILIDIPSLSQRGYQPAVEWFATFDDMPGMPGFVVMEFFQDAPNSRRIR